MGSELSMWAELSPRVTTMTNRKARMLAIFKENGCDFVMLWGLRLLELESWTFVLQLKIVEMKRDIFVDAWHTDIDVKFFLLTLPKLSCHAS